MISKAAARLWHPAGAVLIMTAFVLGPRPALAQAAPADPDPRLIAAAADMALAYVVTGDAAVDETSRAGLAGLSRVLAERTTMRPGAPVAIDLDRDDLSLLTVIYWPVTADETLPSPEGYVRLNHFLQSGGLILFDTRDGEAGASPEQAALRELAAPLDIPPLAPLPEDHVLTRSFYLLHDAPGRWRDTTLWVEAGAAPAAGAGARNDGVSPVVIGANDWAAAWAEDADGMPLHQVGAADDDQQREMARRFGINLIMYAMTGNYKSDQVHVAAVLSRLGRAEGGAVAPAGAADGLMPFEPDTGEGAPR